MNTHSTFTNGQLTHENIEHYQQQGFIIADQLFNTEEIAALRQETIDIFSGERGKLEGLQEVHSEMNEVEILQKYLCIHFPHKFSPLINDYLVSRKIANVLAQIISPNVKAVQSMLFVKAPGKPGQSWHQDEYYIPTRDCSLTGAWIAVDDAYIDNGCLWVVPGSHKPAVLHKRVPYNGDEYGEHDNLEDSLIEGSNAVPVEVKKGSVVFFNGYLLHSSLKNRSKNNFRVALVNHYMSAESYLPWDQDGKYALKNDLRDITMVCGTDPYAYKGTEDVLKPYLRPDKQFIKVS